VATLSVREKAFLEDLFQMSGGYVLNFSSASFGQFIAAAIDIDVWDDRYAYGSGSKANRLRAVWDIEDDETVGRLLVALLEYIDTEITLEHLSESEFKPRVVGECKQTARRLLGTKSTSRFGVAIDDLASLEAFLEQDFSDVEV